MIAALSGLILSFAFGTQAVISQPNEAVHVEPSEPASFFEDKVAQQQWIALQENSNGYLIIPITVNGEKLDALIDTGVPYLSVDAQWAEKRKLKIWQRGQTPTFGTGSIRSGNTNLKEARIGGFGQRGGIMRVLDLSAFKAKAGMNVDAIIGSSFLAYHAFQIDFDNRRVRFLPSTGKTPKGTLVPVSILANSERILTTISSAEGDIGSLMIDTGFNGALSLRGQASQITALSKQRVTDVASVNMDGSTTVEEYAHLHGFKWGDATLPPLPSQFGLNLGKESTGIIGLELLRNFNIHMDARAGNLVLLPRRDAPPPLRVTRAGIQGTITDEGHRIDHVMKGSPAAKALLKAGDRICMVNGRRLTARDNDAQPRWTARPAGTVVALQMCDARKLMLTLEDFY